MAENSDLKVIAFNWSLKREVIDRGSCSISCLKN
jgi:hypothetical protein